MTDHSSIVHPAMPGMAIMGMLQAIRAGLTSLPIVGGLFAAALGGGKGSNDKAAAPASPPLQFASGGSVPGSGSGDSVNALLTPDEYVVKPAPTRAFFPLLEMINSGALPSIPALLSLLPSIPPIGLPPLPSMIPAFAGAGATAATAAGGSNDRSVHIALNVANINVGGGGGVGINSGQSGNQASAQAMAMEMLEQLMPHLERAVVNLLRDQVEKSR